jgi:hypothetical protein
MGSTATLGTILASDSGSRTIKCAQREIPPKTRYSEPASHYINGDQYRGEPALGHERSGAAHNGGGNAAVEIAAGDGDV